MKVTTILFAVTCLLFSCGNKNNGDNNDGKDIVYNEKIQDTFFGVSFGASKDTLIEKFKEHNFFPDEYSTDDWLIFNKMSEPSSWGLRSQEEFFSFGDMSWCQLHVYFSNNKFYHIEFMNTYKTKQEALDNFDGVLNEVSKKYHLYDDPIPNDTTSYKHYKGKTKNRQKITVSCYSYESIGHERWIGVSLSYTDFNFKTVSDEL